MTENFSQGASQTVSGCDRLVTSIKHEGPWEDDRGGAFLRFLRQLERLSETLHMNFLGQTAFCNYLTILPLVSRVYTLEKERVSIYS